MAELSKSFIQGAIDACVDRNLGLSDTQGVVETLAKAAATSNPGFDRGLREMGVDPSQVPILVRSAMHDLGDQ